MRYKLVFWGLGHTAAATSDIGRLGTSLDSDVNTIFFLSDI